MVRLARSRKGKTPVDVTIVNNGGAEDRIRLTLGEDTFSKKNTDLTPDEATDLMALLNYHAEVVRGNI